MAGQRADAQPSLRYATVPDAPRYRAIIDVFTAGAAGYTGRLSPQDVPAVLAGHDGPDEDPPTVEEVAERETAT